jgi:hypothetical protein
MTASPSSVTYDRTSVSNGVEPHRHGSTVPVYSPRRSVPEIGLMAPEGFKDLSAELHHRPSACTLAVVVGADHTVPSTVIVHDVMSHCASRDGPATAAAAAAAAQPTAAQAMVKLHVLTNTMREL